MEYAKCEICGRVMLTADGCSVSHLIIDGKRYKRIRAGAYNDFDPYMEPNDRCHDCGAKAGHFHHWNCDAEKCPKCGEQLIGFHDCEVETEDEFSEDPS